MQSGGGEEGWRGQIKIRIDSLRLEIKKAVIRLEKIEMMTETYRTRK